MRSDFVDCVGCYVVSIVSVGMSHRSVLPPRTAFPRLRRSGNLIKRCLSAVLSTLMNRSENDWAEELEEIEEEEKGG